MSRHPYKQPKWNSKYEQSRNRQRKQLVICHCQNCCDCEQPTYEDCTYGRVVTRRTWKRHNRSQLGTTPRSPKLYIPPKPPSSHHRIYTTPEPMHTPPITPSSRHPPHPHINNSHPQIPTPTLSHTSISNLMSPHYDLPTPSRDLHDTELSSDTDTHNDSEFQDSDSAYTSESSDVDCSSSDSDTEVYPQTEDQTSQDDLTPLLDICFKPLYDGSDLTVLALIMSVFAAKAKFKCKLAVTRLNFNILRWALPSGHNLPTFGDSRRLMRYFGGTNIQRIPCCATRHCDFLFRDRPARHDPHSQFQFANLSHCPQCNSPKNDANGKPRKFFTWLGINEQLKQR